jgi:type IV pilus assembly protein PilP
MSPLLLALVLLAPDAATASAQQPASPAVYIYDPAGRRDPFISLLGTGEPRLPLKRADGFAGLAVQDVSLRGILQTRNALLAMIQGPDKKTYVVHPGDKLLDGVIKAITSQGLVIVQDVSDPASPIKQREVRKPLRSAEERSVAERKP